MFIAILEGTGSCGGKRGFALYSVLKSMQPFKNLLTGILICVAFLFPVAHTAVEMHAVLPRACLTCAFLSFIFPSAFQCTRFCLRCTLIGMYTLLLEFFLFMFWRESTLRGSFLLTQSLVWDAKIFHVM